MSLERTVWGLQFRIRFLEAKGKEFETLFQSILELRFVDEFVMVKAAGSIGDEKNDGLLTQQRKLFGVYAPEGWKKQPTLDKIDADFNGAVAKWSSHFDTWVFVHNDRTGVPPYVLHRLQEHSAATTSHHVCDQWGYAKLRALAFELDDRQLAELLGPPVTVAIVLATEVSDIIPMLRELESIPAALPEAVRPVPADKLDQNNLSNDAADLLRTGMRRSDEVAKYFERQTMRPLFRDDLGQRFTLKYRQLRDDGLDPDEIIIALINWIAGSELTPRTQAAALAVVAFFFEQCDIYEAAPMGASE